MPQLSSVCALAHIISTIVHNYTLYINCTNCIYTYTYTYAYTYTYTYTYNYTLIHNYCHSVQCTVYSIHLLNAHIMSAIVYSSTDNYIYTYTVIHNYHALWPITLALYNMDKHNVHCAHTHFLPRTDIAIYKKFSTFVGQS